MRAKRYSALWLLLSLLGLGSTLAQNAPPQLDWGEWSTDPARQVVTHCHVMDSFDILVLYYGIQGELGANAKEFGHYYPEYANAQNEFARRDAAQKVAADLQRRYQSLQSETLCVMMPQIIVGEYDFQAHGFPIEILVNGTPQPGFPSYTTFSDTSTSGALYLQQINAAGALNGWSYSSLNGIITFDNTTKVNGFPPFLPLSEDTARKVVNEFGHGEDSLAKSIALGLGLPYKGFRTAIGYAVFKPTVAHADASVQEGVSYDLKDVAGTVTTLILATPKGSVLGVFPKSPSAPAHPAPGTPAQTSATTPPSAARAKPPTPAPPPIPYSETRELPLAVLLDNVKGYPQAGLRTASAIYEMPVEGGWTRLMAVYDRGDPGQVGPISSARPYFVDLAVSMIGILVHDGGSPAAMAQIERIKLPDFDAQASGQLFARYGPHPTPYNLYASGQALRQAASRLGLKYSTPVSGDIFQPKDTAKDASSVLVAYSTAYKSGFVYLPKLNQYHWQRNGTPAVDASGEAVLVDAVVVAHITAQPLPNDPKGRLYIPIRGGKATLFIRGKQLSGFWLDQGGFGFSSSGKAIDLTPFKFWVLFVPQWAEVSQE